MPDMRLPSLNLVVLAGRLTQDPELRYTPGGKPVARIRMAVSRVFKGQGGDWQEETLFIDVTAWGNLAERLQQRLTKGSPILVQGRLRSRMWESETGQKRTAIEVVARNIQFLEKVAVPGVPAEVGEDLPSEEGSPEETDLPF